jgi:TonB family protein
VLVAGIAARFAWIAVGLWQLRRLVARARPLEQLPDSVRAAAHVAGVNAAFYESDVSGPISFGVWRGVVLLPRRFAELDSDSQHLVALHELLHVGRRDALQCLAEETLVALFWFYPWIWWIRGRVRLAREQVVDRATAGTRPVRDAYIRTLLGFAGHHPRALPTASGLWRARELRARIDALYKEVIMSRSRLLLSVATIIVALSAIAVVGASAFPLYSTSLPAPPAVMTTAGPTSSFALPAAVRQQSSQEDDVVRVGGDVKPPVKTKHVSPVYPEDAKEAGIQGVVVIEAVINKQGKVATATVIRSIPELDQAALDAVLQWEFEPTYVSGKAVSVRMTVTINFTLARSVQRSS